MEIWKDQGVDHPLLWVADLEGSVHIQVEVELVLGGSLKDSLSIEIGEAGFFVDPRDDKVYSTINIGQQTWMAEDIAYEGPEVNPIPPGINYSYLYNYEDATQACPSGWHLPSDNDWKLLELELGMELEEVDQRGWRGTDQGNMMKMDTSLWLEETENFNSSGFFSTSFRNVWYNLYRPGKIECVLGK